MKVPFQHMMQRRITAVLLFFFVAFGILLGRLFLLQIASHREYRELAAKQQERVRELAPERGTVFVRDKKDDFSPIALTRVYKTLVVSPKRVTKQEEVITFLEKEFGLDPADIAKKLSQENDPYEVLVRKIDPEKVENITVSDFPGLFFEEEKRRFYPSMTRAAHLLGFVSQEHETEEGKYGIERYYEKELAGKGGLLGDLGEGAGFLSTLSRRIFSPLQNGADLFLTVDGNIQGKAEEVLAAVKQKWQPSSATVLVTEPATGKILALAALPVFNPNEFGKIKDFSTFLNPAVESTYELGSVMKPITMAGALEESLIRPDTTYEDTGEVRIGGYTVKNFDEKAYHRQTMTQVLEKSLNTGAVYAARILGKEKQLSYLKQFGFGAKTGVDLPGEVAGNISNLDAGRDIDFATAAFGQGIAITPLQLAMAVGAIANGGTLMKPYVVEKIIDDSGNETMHGPQEVRRVISKEASDALSRMLVSAVRNGFENRASIKGYFVAGKTGTAQIPKRDGRGYSDKVIHTFVGYAPAFNPRFLVLLQLNEPVGNRFAANTLTPPFHDLAEYILNYYEVPPDEK